MGITSRTDRATDTRLTAATLLEAYYCQDERERHLLSGNVWKAAAAGANALEKMATAYEMEFPWLDRSRARAAGRAFMHALFVQDEIENWEGIRAVPTDLREVLVCDPGGRYGPDPVSDIRWESVEASLRTTCRTVGIDERYASLQTRFWVLHGQSDPRWEEVARSAHELKLRAMVEDPPEDAVDRLGRRFVDGVRLHDGWTHRDESADLDDAVDLVAAYYDEVFSLRTRGGEA